MLNHDKLTSGTKYSKHRISFLDKSILRESKSFHEEDMIEIINRPDFVSWFIELKKKSDPKSTSNPVIRERLSNGYRIIDLRLDRMTETLKLIKNHCIQTDPLCKAIDIASDHVSLKTLDYILMRKIADWHSVCAIEEGTRKLVGVIIGSLQPKNNQERTETRIRPDQGQGLFYLMTLNSCLISKSQIYGKLNVENYFRMYILYVKKQHRGKGIGLALFRSFIDKSRELKNSVCVGAFYPGPALIIARRLGFKFLEDISFKDALLLSDIKDPFSNSRIKNEKLYCMSLTIELIPEISISDAYNPWLKTKADTKKDKKKKKTK